MTGPEHYREAARLLQEAGTVVREHAGKASFEGMQPLAEAALAAAQVHATLALAAAAAELDIHIHTGAVTP